jgi:branched-chain amino acid transport system permease protein
MTIEKTAFAPARASIVPARLQHWRFVYEPLVFAAIVSVLYLVVPANWQFVLTQGLIYALFATSLGMLFGWSGIYTFGHAVFFGIGSYAVALTKDFDLSPMVFLLIGAVVAGAIAALIGLLGLRLVKVEFAMMTLIIGQIAYQLTYRIDGLEGDNGIYGVARGDLLGWNVTPPNSFWWYVLLVVVVVLMILRRINLSPFGLALNALRDDPVKAAATGIPVRAMRLVVFTIAGAVAGLAGGLFAQHQGIVTPNTLAFLFSGQVIIMALLGGMNRFWGPAVGALVFVGLNFAAFSGSSNANLILGIILLVVVLLLPQGLLGVVAWVRGAVVSRRKRVDNAGA